MREQNESGPALLKLEAEIEEMTPRIAAWQNRREILDRLRGTKQAIAEQKQLLVQAESGGEVAKAASIRYGALKYLEEQRADLERQTAAFPTFQGVPEVLGAEHVAEVVAERVGVPIQRLLESERDRLLKLEERIGSRVLGQEEAVAAVADASRRMRADMRIGSKPNSFLFVGPTGVGKTELAKALAEALFDDEMALIRIDMGEYKDSSASAGLIGSRPGLV
jgi:ATP-dependent Clp protease ATP-binding subunit ClpB